MWPARRCWDSRPPRVLLLRAGARLSPPCPTGSVTREAEGPLPREEENNLPTAGLTPESLEEGRLRSQRLQPFLGETPSSFKGNQTASHKLGTKREHRPARPEEQPGLPSGLRSDPARPALRPPLRPRTARLRPGQGLPGARPRSHSPSRLRPEELSAQTWSAVSPCCRLRERWRDKRSARREERSPDT